MANRIIKSFLPKLMGLRLMTLYKIKPEKAIYKAFKLFCTPRGGFVKPHQKDFLNAHKAEQIIFKKIKIQTYRWSGSGPKVLLLHGWDSNAFRWKDLVRHLKSKDYDVMAFDAPAQGYSEGNLLSVPIYNEVLNSIQRGFSPQILIGHSMGGMTAIYNQHQKRNPDIRKMVLLGAPSDLKRIMDGFQKILRLSDRFMKATENYFKDRYGFYFSEFNSKVFGGDIKVPTLIVHDKYDKIVPYNEAYDIHEAIEKSQLMITEGAGHSLHKERIYLNILYFLEKD